MDTSGKRQIALDRPAFYRIEVTGRLNPRWVTDMCDATVVHRADADGQVVTTITGELMDQAALMGVLNLAYNFGHALLSLENLNQGERPKPDVG
jgi:hypothetical protein